jgi:hypothetical protein
MVSDVSMLAARHAAEIDALATREAREGREAVRSRVLTMTASALREKGYPAIGIGYVPVPAR